SPPYEVVVYRLPPMEDEHQRGPPLSQERCQAVPQFLLTRDATAYHLPSPHTVHHRTRSLPPSEDLRGRLSMHRTDRWIRASLWHASRRIDDPGALAQLPYPTMRAPRANSSCAALSRTARLPTSQCGTPDPGSLATRLP